MAWDILKEEKFAELTNLARNKANTLGNDGYVVSEPFRKIHNVILGETWQLTPSAESGIIAPSYDAYGVQGAVASRQETSLLHSYLASGVDGPNSVQTFFVVSDSPASHSTDDIETVRRKNLISPEFSPNKSHAAEDDPNVRGFELALYPAASSSGGLGNTLIADVNKGPIPISADPSSTYGLGEGFWSVDYIGGIVRFSGSPLNGSSGVMNPNNVFGDLEGTEVEDAYGAITMFATYYQYTGAFGDVDESNFVVVGDGYISNAAFEGASHNVVQLALDSLTNGGTVFIKEGDYTFADTVTVSANKSVIGLNGRVNILAPGGSSAFDITGSDVTMEGLPIRTTNASTGGSCIEISGSTSGETLDNIQIKNNTLWCKQDAYGVEISPNASNITYKNLSIRNNVFKTEPDNDSLFVTVGVSGEIQTSSDGITWTARTPAGGFSSTFWNVAHDGSGLFCAVGNSGEIQTSFDGITWTQRTPDNSTTNAFFTVAYNGFDLWCTAGASGEIQTSPDGITWTARTSADGFSGSFNEVAHDGAGLWCAVGSLGTIQTSINGITWTSRDAESFTNTWSGVAYNGSDLWCAVGNVGEIQTSPDGITWTAQTAAGAYSDDFREVAYNGSNLWCAVGETGEIQTSSNGITWTARTNDGGFASNFFGIIYNNSNLWCATGQVGEIQTSPDGITWTAQTNDGSVTNAFESVSFPPASPTYIGEKYEVGSYSFKHLSITENQFDAPSTGIGKILLNSHHLGIDGALISQNVGRPRLDLTGLDGYMSDVFITNNALKSIVVGDFLQSTFSNNMVQGNANFGGLDKCSVSSNSIGGFFTSPSVIRTNLVGNYVFDTDLDISTSCHITDGYISTDGPNIYVNDNLLPATTGQELGSRNNRWDGYFTRLDIGDGTTTITDGYINANRDLEISTGPDNNIVLHSKVILKDGYLESDDVNINLSAGSRNIRLHSKTNHLGPRLFFASEWSSRASANVYSDVDNLISVYHNGSDLWCTVGSSGSIETSPDGVTWTARTAAGGFSNNLSTVAHNGSDLWCAVGDSGEIQTSPDAITWTARTAAGAYSDTFTGVAYNGSDLWCAVGTTTGEIQTSPDGITWTARTADNSFTGNFREIAHNSSNLWCAVGDSGEIQTSINGVTWTARTADASTTNNFLGIAYNSSDLWCATGASGEIQTSTNGVTWTQQTPDNSYTGNFTKVAHDGSGLWCAVGWTGEIQTSPDGITWTTQPNANGFTGNFFGIANDGNGLWCATGDIGEIHTALDNNRVILNNGTIRLDSNVGATTISDGYIESIDGYLGISAGLHNIDLYSKVVHHGPNNSLVTIDNGEVRVGSGTTVLRDGYLESTTPGVDLELAAGPNNRIKLHSRTAHLGPRLFFGSEWVARVPDNNHNDDFREVVYNGFDLWCAVGDAGEIQTSPDAITWTKRLPDNAISDSLLGIDYNKISNLWCLAGASGTIQTSQDGINWTARTADASYSGGFNGIAYNSSNLWCAVGDSGEIQTSPDAITWTQRTPDNSYSSNWLEIFHNGSDLWCAVGVSGEIQTSPDGITWTARTADASYTGTFAGVAHNGSDLWCAVGPTGEIQTSPDGITWTARTADESYTGTFNGVGHNGSDLWCAVGSGGEIQTSPDGITWTARTAADGFSNSLWSVDNDGAGLWCAVGQAEIQTARDNNVAVLSTDGYAGEFNATSGRHGIKVNAQDGYGIITKSSTGYALYVEGDTSPNPRTAPMRIVPQDIEPVSYEKGDIWVNSSGKMQIAKTSKGPTELGAFGFDRVVQQHMTMTTGSTMTGASTSELQVTNSPILGGTIGSRSTLRFKASGEITTYTSGTLQLRMRYDTDYTSTAVTGTLLFDFGTWTPVVNDIFMMEGVLHSSTDDGSIIRGFATFSFGAEGATPTIRNHSFSGTIDPIPNAKLRFTRQFSDASGMIGQFEIVIIDLL